MKKIYILLISMFAMAVSNLLQHYYDLWAILGVHQHTYRAIYKAIAHLSLPLLIVSSLLFLLRDEIFHSWLRFAYWWLSFQVFVIVFVIISEINNIGGFMSISFAEPLSMLLSGVFFVVSIVLIFSKFISLKITPQK